MKNNKYIIGISLNRPVHFIFFLLVTIAGVHFFGYKFIFFALAYNVYFKVEKPEPSKRVLPGDGIADRVRQVADRIIDVLFGIKEKS